MKDIFDLLNEVKIDETEFEELEVTELEKARVKRDLKRSISTQKMKPKWKMKTAATAVVLALSITTFGLAFPAYAVNIPIIGDIFKFLGNEETGMYANYKENSTELNMKQDSKGIQVTINDAIYDGNTVVIAYSITTAEDLGENINVFGTPDIKGAQGLAGSSQIKKVSDHQYVGLYRASDLGKPRSGTVDVKWNLDSIMNYDTEKEIKGDWKFRFSLDATDSQVQMTNVSTVQNGVHVTVDKVSFTPMSFIVYYDQKVSDQVIDKWHDVYVELEIRDDLGNEYAGEGNGGSGEDFYTMSWSKTFEKLDPRATRLIVTPHVTFSSQDETNFGGVEIAEDGKETAITIPAKPGVGREEFKMDEIVIELEK